ncbi:MAG TPA: hypothetical protein VKI61_10515 [Chitinophagaceae bacterium]|nr:hypothetical protein [Chitinophagaceae bacterium]
MRVNTKSFPVHAVAKFSGLNPATDMYDDIHPNSTGEKTMAKRWYDAIKIHLKKLS